MSKIQLTVLIATKNEAANISKCIRSLGPASRIVVLDSNSGDGTQKIARKAGAEVIQFRYKGGYPKKRQWALDNLKINTKWVLLIDADEEVPSALWEEIGKVVRGNTPCAAFLIKKGFYFMGQRFRFGGFSFDAVLLIEKGKARFEQLVVDSVHALDMEVHERLVVDGPIGRLKSPLIHNDYKGLEAYLDRHNKYSTWEARLRKTFIETGCYGMDSVKSNLFGNSQEKRRFLKKIIIRIPLEPILWFAYHYFLRFGFLEGKKGFIASKIRAQYIFQVRAKLYELRLRKKPAGL